MSDHCRDGDGRISKRVRHRVIGEALGTMK